MTELTLSNSAFYTVHLMFDLCNTAEINLIYTLLNSEENSDRYFIVKYKVYLRKKECDIL